MQGKTINGYTLQRPIGTGGMAEVWYAENSIGKSAAVKLLLPKLCDDESVKLRFYTEAKVMVELDHPNIRQVYDMGEIDGRPAIIMEYLEGSDLKTWLKRGKRFSEEELEKWWNQLVDALNYTHQKGVVHRDIKPSNIFIDKKGDVKLLDFGIAKVADVSSGTQTGSTLGTRIYMSPEQVKDPKRVGAKSDVYSLAVSFVHLLTGKAPYDSTTSSDFDIQLSIVTKPVDLSPLPESWQHFLAPYLAKEPDERPDLRYFEVDGNEEGTVVESASQPTPVPVVPPTPKPTSKPAPKPTPAAVTPSPSAPNEQPKKKTGLWIGLALALLAVVGVVVWRMMENGPDNQDQQKLESARVSDSIAKAEALAQAAAAAEEAAANAAAEEAAKAAEAEAQAQKDAELKAKEEEAAKTAYMDIVKVEFENADYDGNPIVGSGKTLYASEMRYLQINAKYNGLLDTSKDVELFVKIIQPDGQLMHGSGSPKGYTYSCSVKVKPGKNNSCGLKSWGNDDVSVYTAGKYTLEIWFQEKRIYKTTVTLKEDAATFSDNIAKNTTTTNTTVNKSNPLSQGKWRSALKKCVYNVTTNFENGDSYKGQLSYSANETVIGLYCYKNGGYYIGDFKNGKFQGYGLYLCKDGSELNNCPGCVYYSGGWANSRKSGTGFCFDKYGQLIYAGNFSNDKPTDPYPSSDTNLGVDFECFAMDNNAGYYVGTTSNGAPFSFGMFIFKEGDLLYGASNNGNMIGELMMLKFDGNVHTGTWKELTGE